MMCMWWLNITHHTTEYNTHCIPEVSLGTSAVTIMAKQHQNTKETTYIGDLWIEWVFFLLRMGVFPVENSCLSTILNGRQQTTCNDLAGETECQDDTPKFFSTKLLVSLRNILENIRKKKHLRSCSTWPLALLWITQVVGKMGVKTTNIRNAGCNSSYLRPLGAIVSHFENNYRCLPEPPTAEVAMDNNPKMGKKDQLWMPE